MIRHFGWLTRYLVLVVLVLLDGCNGNAPLLTCQDPCAHSNEYRDLFCVCQVKPPPGTVGARPPPPPPPPTPYFYWFWDEYGGCALNRKYFLYNPSSKTYVVKVSWKVPGKNGRDERDVNVPPNTTSPANTTTPWTENFLDWEEVKLSGDQLCFDRDFQIATYRELAYASPLATAFARLSETEGDLLAEKGDFLSQLKDHPLTSAPQSLSTWAANKGATIQIHRDSKIEKESKPHTPIDCIKACDNSDPLRCPIRGYPPDQEKLKQVRDRLRNVSGQGEYKAAEIFTIFGLAKTACERSDIEVLHSKLFNTGQYCAFPTFLRESDKDPALSLHFPTAVKAQQIKRDDTTAGIAFSAGSGAPILLFANRSLNTNYGGLISDAIASPRGVYYQTSTSCIFLGVK